MVNRKVVKALQTQIRNDGRANYKGFVIFPKPTSYWIGRHVNGEFVFHTSCQTVAECVKWMDAENDREEKTNG